MNIRDMIKNGVRSFEYKSPYSSPEDAITFRVKDEKEFMELLNNMDNLGITVSNKDSWLRQNNSGIQHQLLGVFTRESNRESLRVNIFCGLSEHNCGKIYSVKELCDSKMLKLI